jgi:hypothetical protein
MAKKKSVECEDSPDGKHHFICDLEYDSTGNTINCEHCGEPMPEEPKGETTKFLVMAYNAASSEYVFMYCVDAKDHRSAIEAALNVCKTDRGEKLYMGRQVNDHQWECPASIPVEKATKPWIGAEGLYLSAIPLLEGVNLLSLPDEDHSTPQGQ